MQRTEQTRPVSKTTNPRDTLLEERLRSLLEGSGIDEIRAFQRCDSTNAEARRWLDAGGPTGALFFAEYQTAGRGRMGRSWTSAAGKNLTFSIVLPGAADITVLSVSGPAVALAVAEAIETTCPALHLEIKWPNDVLCDGHKLAGVLIETSAVTDRRARTAVIVGVGLNVNQVSFPSDLRFPATSIRTSVGVETDRLALMPGLVRRIVDRLPGLAAGENTSEVAVDHVSGTVRDVQARLYGLGARAVVAAGAETFEGTIRGLDASGGLVVQTDKRQRVVYAGEVTSVGLAQA